MRAGAVGYAAIVTWVLFAPSTAAAQAMPDIGFKSVGRDWPVEPALPSKGRDPALRMDRPL